MDLLSALTSQLSEQDHTKCLSLILESRNHALVLNLKNIKVSQTDIDDFRHVDLKRINNFPCLKDLLYAIITKYNVLKDDGDILIK